MHSQHKIRGIAQPAAEQSAGNASHVEPDPDAPASEENELFRPRCLSLDLEIGRQDGRIHAIGAVRADTGERLVHSGAGLAEALLKLDELADGASFVLGHNLIAFDLPHLAAAKPDLRLLTLPAVDTLRLSPLAFPRHPYHHLVKHYQDGGLKRGRVNDPELDARLALEVFGDQRRALKRAPPDLLAAWHWLCTPKPEAADRALDELFGELSQPPRPSEREALAAIGRCLEGAACATHGREILAKPKECGWPLAYALAWLSVAGGNSVMPPWVRHQFPETGHLVRRLRDLACADPGCAWCRERHDARKELKRWFGFDEFRPEPADDDGRPMQQARIEEFEAAWGERYPAIVPAWRRAWDHVVPMFAFPPQIRKTIYTTNALESLHRSLRKIIKTRGSFPSDEAATKLLYLAIRNAGMRWKRPVAWTAAMGQFAILFEERFPASAR